MSWGKPFWRMAALPEDMDIPGGRRQPKPVPPAPHGISRHKPYKMWGSVVCFMFLTEMRSTMLRACGKCCPGTSPPANHGLIFLSQSRPELCAKWNVLSFHSITKASPKSFTTECPLCWGGQQAGILPVAQQPREIWAVVASGADRGAKHQPPPGEGRSLNLRTSSVVQTVHIPVWIHFLCSGLWDSVVLMHWFANILMLSCSLYMLYKGIECYISM